MWCLQERQGSQNGYRKRCRQTVVRDGVGEMSRHFVILEYVGNAQCNSKPIERCENEWYDSIHVHMYSLTTPRMI